MIILATTASGIEARADSLQHRLGERVQTIDPRESEEHRSALEEASLLVLDETFAESSPLAAEEASAAAAQATLLELNFAICGPDRMLREIKRALHRRRREHLAALESARRALSSELKGILTGMLLTAELACESPAMQPELRERLATLRALATDLQERLMPAKIVDIAVRRKRRVH